jgi:hypothetical protein
MTLRNGAKCWERKGKEKEKMREKLKVKRKRKIIFV